MAVVEVVIVTPLRLFGESLARCLQGFDDLRVARVLDDTQQLLALPIESPPQLVLLDVTARVEGTQTRAIVERWPSLPLLALGLAEQREAVIDCGRAGFVGYVARDASLAQVRQAILDAAAGRLSCPTHIAAGLMRALRSEPPPPAEVESMEEGSELTRRENQVAAFIGRGLSNKEIARELRVSVATVKHHVHNILTKLKLPTRSRVARLMTRSARPALVRDLDSEC